MKNTPGKKNNLFKGTNSGYITQALFWLSIVMTVYIFPEWWKQSVIPLSGKVPVQIPSIFRVLDFIYTFTASCLVLFSAVGWGRIASQKILKEEFPWLSNLATGVWILTFFSFLAGIAGLLNHAVLIFFLVIPVFFKENRLYIPGLKHRVTKTINSFCPFIRFLLLLFAIYLLYNYLSCYLPIAESDGLRYHASIPELYFREGRIRYIPLNAFSNFPFTGEMLYIYAFALGRDIIIKFLHFHFFLLCGLALIDIMRKENVKKPWQIIGSAWFLSIPFLPVLGTWSFNDFIWCFFLFLNLAHLKRFLETDREKELWLSMFFLGISFSAKYSVLLIIFIEAFCLAVFYPRKCLEIIRRHRTWILSLLLLFMPILPYLLKNLLYTGNPVYPMANTLFHGGEWGIFESEFYFAKTAEKGLAPTVANLLRSPLILVREWTKFESWNPGISFLSGFIVLLVPFRGKYFNFYRMFFLLFYVSWFFSYQSNRFLMPFIMGVIPFACIVFGRIKYHRIIAIIIVITAVFNLLSWFTLTWYAYNPLPYFTGSQSKNLYLEQKISYYRAAHYLNRRKEQLEGYVLFLGEHRRYYVEYPHLYVSDWFDPPYILYYMRRHQPSDPADFLETLHNKEDVQLIFYNQRELFTANNYEYFRQRFSDPEWEFYLDFMELLKGRGRTIFPGLILFDVKEILLNEL